ncbi:MAG: hypothetical protein U5L04_12400 [Trueperaceae bacterium]|nr:hypothetical protein [Trueperaceae bacterium]
MQDTDPTKTLTPMLEALLTGDVPPKDRPLLAPPKNRAEAEAQIRQMLQEHAVEMDVLAEL